MLKPLGPYVVPARRKRELMHVPYFALSVCFTCRRTVDYLHTIAICERRAALICDDCDTRAKSVKPSLVMLVEIALPYLIILAMVGK